jgi:hypothetical protein
MMVLRWLAMLAVAIIGLRLLSRLTPPSVYQGTR